MSSQRLDGHGTTYSARDLDRRSSTSPAADDVADDDLGEDARPPNGPSEPWSRDTITGL